MIPESIKKLANKVRNEIYGRDVRESIAQSMEVSGETSNEANERSKDTAERQTDVENRFDDQIAGNTDIDEVIDARRPEGGESYPTLRKRLDDEHKEVTAQLAQIATDLKSFGAVGDRLTDDTNAIRNAFSSLGVDYRTLIIQDGEFLFNSHITIENKSDFTIIFKNAKLVDEAKTISTTAGSGKAPHGISFINCTNFNVVGMENDSLIDMGGTTLSTFENDRVPHVDLVSCRDFEVQAKAYGLVGTYISNLKLGAAHFMKASYYRFYNCSNFKANDMEIDGNSGGGEFFSFADCSNFEFLRGKHHEQTNTFWSFANLINCKQVKTGQHDIKSSSTGSLIDVSGSDIEYSTMYVDYPNGKLLDITAEWGVANTDTNNLSIDKFRSQAPITSVGDIQEYQMVADDVVIRNGKFYNPQTTEPITSKYSISGVNIKKLIVRDVDFYNMGQIVNNGGAGNSVYHKKHQFFNCDITTDKTISDGNVEIRSHGELIFSDGAIDLNGKNTLVFNDRYYDTRTVLPESDNIFIIRNTTIKNTVIALRGNFIFENCELHNVSFTSHYATDEWILDNYPSVTFNNTKLLYNLESDLMQSDIFDINSHHKIIFNNSEISGMWKNVRGAILFNKLMNGNTYSDESVFELNNTKIDLKRFVSVGDVRNAPIITKTNGDSKSGNFVFNSSEINNAEIRILRVSDITPSNIFKLIIKNSDLSQALFNITNNNDGVNLLNEVELIASGNMFEDSNLSNLTASEHQFKKIVNSNNTGV